jgi:V/A-type H+-transporting ATPase subunit I
MFGIPAYYEYDPTPLIAILMPIYFGLMLSDFFYGFITFLISIFLIKKGIEDLGYLLLINSVSAMFFGAIFGSYFGNFFKEFLGIEVPSLHLSTMEIVIISAAMGFLSILLVRMLAFLVNIEKKDWKSALSELGIITLELGLGLLFLPNCKEYSMPLIILGLILVVASNIIINGMMGLLFTLMDLSGLLGDVLSFLRISALLIATGYVASSFNHIIRSFIGNLMLIPIAILAFLALHFINLFSSTLGAMAHSLRLLFVELLPKVYEGKGVPFEPLRIKQKITIQI